MQRVHVPLIEEDAKGDAFLQGAYDLGEGQYKVDWLMRDRTERVCASNWDVEATLPEKDKNLAMTLSAGRVAATLTEQFIDEPVLRRGVEANPVNVKVLVNFAPQNMLSSTLRPADTGALVSILRQLQRDPRIGRYSVVAFNLQQQKVLYRQESSDHIDFPGIGKALESLQLGRVAFDKLGEKNSDTNFLADFIKQELTTSDTPDALIFAGPKAMLDQDVPVESLRSMGEPSYPVFYMNYNLNPQNMPWRDAISRAVRFFKGQEFTISRPRDLWYAVSEIVSKIVKSKEGRRTAGTTAALN
jgi:hypothetical protein